MSGVNQSPPSSNRAPRDGTQTEPSGSDGVAELTVKNDVAGELELGQWHTFTLENIADRGGEIPWDWNVMMAKDVTPAKLAARNEMIADLIVHGLVVEREYVTHARQLNGKLALRLTDKGRNVVELHRQRKIVAGAVKVLA